MLKVKKLKLAQQTVSNINTNEWRDSKTVWIFNIKFNYINKKITLNPSDLYCGLFLFIYLFF